MNWEGTWVGSRHLPNEAAIPDDYRGTLKKVQIVIKPDGTFTMEAAGVPYEGDFSADSEVLTLRFRMYINRPIDETDPQIAYLQNPATLAKRRDGTILFTAPAWPLSEPVEMRRIAPSEVGR